MKKIFFLAAATAALFASCAKESQTAVAVRDIDGFSIRIDEGAIVSTTMRNATGPYVNVTDNTADITLSNVLVVVFNEDDTFNKAQYFTGAGDMGELQNSTGKLITGTFKSNVKVMVLGNLAGTAAEIDAKVAEIKACADLTAVNAVMSSIRTQTTYSAVSLGNVEKNTPDGKINSDELAPITEVSSGSDAYIANVAISPLISRIEILDIAATTDPDAAGDYIATYTVTGVFLSNFYDSFTYGGSGAGTLFNQDDQTTKTDFTALNTFWSQYADGALTGAGSQVGTAGSATFSGGALNTATPAKLAGTNIWSYNVASKGMPNIIIRLTNVTTMKGDGSTAGALYNGTQYIRISGYKKGSDLIGNMERGQIYRLGGSNPIKFTTDNLSATPTVSADKTINVAVTIQNWKVESPSVVIE